MTPPRSLHLAPPARLRAWCIAGLCALLLAGCTTPVQRANQLVRAGRLDEALALLQQANAENPLDDAARAQLLRQRGLRVQQLLAQVESARSVGRFADAARALDAATALEPDHPRVATLRGQLGRADWRLQQVDQARAALAQGRHDEAEALARQVLAEEPGHPAAGALAQEIGNARLATAPALQVDQALRKPISLELREAPLRSVFESLSRASGIGFVFDREVRVDGRVTLFLRETTVDEALRIVLSTQGLRRKLLNPTTMMVYANTAAKQREHEELSTRAFYLVNSDVKQVQQMVRALAKTRDLHVDERLNLLLVRDTPDVLRLVEKLVATVDLAEPEVTLDVQVLEVATDRKDSIGLKWPSSASYGLSGADALGALNPPGLALIGAQKAFRGWIANPALLATLLGDSGGTTLLANPSIRVRNREKARVKVGDKLPVFTTTSTANVGVSSSVSYLDVGLKLEIEPSVQPGNEVTMKVSLEVSNLVSEVQGPQGALAYRVGTREATTVLRLKDGETQVLAGLISDEDRKRASGIPGLSTLPVLGALFGNQTDQISKTEVVLLITPHVVRNLAVPPFDGMNFPAGLDADPGAQPLRLGNAAKAAAAPGAPAATSRSAGQAAAAPAAAPLPPTEGAVLLEASTTGRIGETVSITVKNSSALLAQGVIVFDAALLQPASGGVAPDGRTPFDLPPQGELALVLRVLPAAAGAVVAIALEQLSGVHDDGRRVVLPSVGAPMIEIAVP